MNNKISTSFIFLFSITTIVASLIGCTGAGGSGGGHYLAQNIVLNSSFEIGDTASLMYWFPSDTTSHLHFSSDVAPGCGKYAIVLTPSNDSLTYNLTYSLPYPLELIPQPTMSVWAKAVSGTGTFSVNIFHPKGIAHFSGPIITDTAWRRYVLTIADTNSSVPDSMIVYLTATASGGSAGKVYFDSCSILEYTFLPPQPDTAKNGAEANPIH